MSLRRVDARFCLAEPPRTARVLGGLEGWRDGLAEAGVEVRLSGRIDLVVAPVSAAAEAIATDAGAVILEGRGGSRQLSPVLSARSVLVRPRADRAELLLPLDERTPLAYAISNWSAGYTRRKRIRNAVASRLARHGLLREIEPVVSIGTRGTPGLPYVVRASGELGVTPDAGWFMTCGHGDALSRNVFHVFPAGADLPAWALKFSRVPGYDDSFRRDELGLALAASAGPTVSAHAPRLLGRFTVDGLEASLETAAAGRRLRTALVAPGASASKIGVIEEIAGWLLAVARDTAAPAEALRPEIDRLGRDVLPAWSSHVQNDLLVMLSGIPAVLQHNDVGSWNVVVSESGFTAVDWESARRHGLPLWDLAYFLTDALVTLEQPGSPSDQAERARRLLRGESPRSALLFSWIGRAARELGIPGGAVGPIVTLGWLHHALSRHARAEALETSGVAEDAATASVGRLASIWLDDPALGPQWRAWHV